MSGHQDGGDVCTLSGSGILVHSEQEDWIEMDYRLAVHGILTDVELVVRMDIVYIHKQAMGSWQMLSGKSAWGLFIFTGWQWDPGRC